MFDQRGRTQECRVCGQENARDAVKCVQCGLPLPPTTLQFTDSDLDQFQPTDAPARPDTLGDLPAGTLSFYVQGRSRPLTARARQTIILGRDMDMAGNSALVDLSDAGAVFLGVSRKHAAIQPFGHSCIIEDLDSVNGTWVNENRLVPGRKYTLRSGDKIRLGRLIIIFVHYPFNPSRFSALH